MAVTGLTLTEEERTRFVRRNTALLSGAQASIWITVGVVVAVGLLLAAGTVGAIVGPQLVQLAHLLSPQSSQSARLAASWMIAAIFSAVAFGCMLALRPDPKDLAPPRKTPVSTVKRSLRTLLQLPAMRAGAIAMGLAQGAMTGLMAVYAIAASARGVGIGVIALILSAHFSGMFGFSPVWGVFLDRIGRRDGLLAGAALIAIGGLTIGLPHAALSALGLFLVGLGWSGTYLGGTTVISDITTPAARHRAWIYRPAECRGR